MGGGLGTNRLTGTLMKINISIHVDTDTGEVSVEDGPQGTEALIEHADHDSTPRQLGFTAEPPRDDSTL